MLKRYFIALAAIVLLWSSVGLAESETLFNLSSGGKDIIVSMDGDTVTMSVKTIDDTAITTDPEEIIESVEPEVIAAKTAEMAEVAEVASVLKVAKVIEEEYIPVEEDVVAVVVAEGAVEAEKTAVMSGSTMGMLFFVFILAIFLGIELIAKVPSQLHTPLMSGSNAISGITVVGALLAVRSSVANGNERMAVILGVLAVAFAMINVVGGYLVTDRMLGMFKHKD